MWRNALSANTPRGNVLAPGISVTYVTAGNHETMPLGDGRSAKGGCELDGVLVKEPPVSFPILAGGKLQK
jgi:hypothetical protein